MNVNRREFMAGSGAAGLSLVQPPRMRASAPTAPVAIARCKTYGPEFLAATGKMFDQLGGMGRLVKGKTVTIKINLTGGETTRLDHLPQGRTFWTHPRTVGAVIHLLDRAGARRIRVVEGAWAWPASLEEFMLKAGWDPDLVLGAAPRVELINTNMPYKGKKPYTRFQVPRGGHLFPAFDLSTAYAESDVLVSMAKIKEHATAGVTLSIKNLFGISPTTIYGDKVPLDEPAPIPYAGRGEIGHAGSRQPPKSSPPEKDPTSPRDGGYRIPRFIADLAAAAPVSLAILEGIETIAGAELPRRREYASRQSGSAGGRYQRGDDRRSGDGGDGLRPPRRPRPCSFRDLRQYIAAGGRIGRRDSRSPADRSGWHADQGRGVQLPRA